MKNYKIKLYTWLIRVIEKALWGYDIHNKMNILAERVENANTTQEFTDISSEILDIFGTHFNRISFGIRIEQQIIFKTKKLYE